ncbi:MAG: hypothetical protein ACFE8G_15535 [Candidatus Hermodarchaeota archaeon]
MGESESGLGMASKSQESWLGGDFVTCKLISKDGNEELGEFPLPFSI